MGKRIELKFLFANKDGLTLELSTEVSATVAATKERLLAQWPEAAGPVPAAGQIRFICMGLGILPDPKTLEACKIPVFTTHATPINVSVREVPAAKTTQEDDAATAKPEAELRNSPTCSCSIQ